MTVKLTHAQVDRACGVILGAATGDALGAGYEFGCAPLSPDETPGMIGGGLGDFDPGEWTDDTSMTLGVLRVAATGHDLRSDDGLTAVAREFAAWFATSPPDVGINTRAVLRAAGSNPTGAAMTAAARARHERTGRTGSNGSLMRTSPVALAYLDDPDGLVEAARAVGGLTHPDPDAQDACVLWCLAIRHAVLTGELDLRAGVARLAEDRRDLWSERIDRAETEHPSTFRPNGWAVTALMAAWASIFSTPVPVGDRFDCEHLVDALGTAVHVGDDTDTVASIAGALLGARWGMSAIPAAWRRMLHGYPGLESRDLERLAFLAAHRGETGKYGWPLVEHIDYEPLQHGRSVLALHPLDGGVWMASATELDRLPDDVDAVVTLCLTGTEQVPADIEQVTFRLQDVLEPAANPNLDFVIVDAARTVAALRAEGKRVLLHCVASHSRTPTVAIAYALMLGAPLDEAIRAVCEPLPCARPNRGFRKALHRLESSGRLAPAPENPERPDPGPMSEYGRGTDRGEEHMNQSWEASGLLPTSDSTRVRKYRRLQSWYREVQLQVPAGPYPKDKLLGSYLSPAAVAERPDLNFLHPAAFEHATDRADAVQKEGGSLEEKRLFHNMLSSMPLCFNLFGAMRGELESFLPVFRSLFDTDATRITDIVCEWAPNDPAARIGDRTAFDAIIRYEADGERRFVGVETKYTESFSPRIYDPPQYREVTADSDWFTDDPSAPDRLKQPKANQLWRNVMLASRLEQHGSEGRGSVAVVALSDDPGASTAVDLVGAEMAPLYRDRLRNISIESILDITDALSPELSWWTTSFRRRYIDVSLPDSDDAERDPAGPRRGRGLMETMAAGRSRSSERRRSSSGEVDA